MQYIFIIDLIKALQYSRNKDKKKMKKICLILLILIVGTIISCNDSSSGDSLTGYVDPFAGAPPAPKTTGSNLGNAHAIIYTGGSQVGIAVDRGSYILKIYWSGSALTTYNGITGTFVAAGGTQSDFGPIDITITPNSPSDNLCSITFSSAIDSVTSITAYMYP